MYNIKGIPFQLFMATDVYTRDVNGKVLIFSGPKFDWYKLIWSQTFEFGRAVHSWCQCCPEEKFAQHHSLYMCS